MWNQIKTLLLLASLSGLVLGIGALFGGKAGLTVAFVLALVMNFGMYLFSHKLVLLMYRAEPMKKSDHPHVHKIVAELSKQMGIPMPALYIIPTQTPNAFATGPSPDKAVVACTQGILSLLTDHELKGVLAHELSHVKNRDMLVTTIAATLATIISYLASMARYAALFGSNDRDRNGGNLLSIIILGILSPIIALILQLAISRSREYLADETGAKTTGDASGLASALKKLEIGCKTHPLHGNPATSSLFIVNPFTARSFASLFSTHPPTKDRIERLEGMKL